MEEKTILKKPYLPVDVLELIMKRLPLKDYLRLRAICRSCRKIVSNIIENKHCCPLPELPSLSTKSLHRVRTPLLRDNTCIGSVDGWLIVSDNSEKGFAKIFFLNPVTDVRITIPSKLHLPSIVGQSISYVTKLTASSKPNCDGSDCYLAGLFSDYCHIAIYKLFEKSWTIVESDKDSGTYFTDIEIIGTKLYVIGSLSDSILVYDLKDSTNAPRKAEVLAELPRAPAGSSIHSSFLAKDKMLRELYLISVFYNGEIDTEQHISDRFNVVSSFVKPPKLTSFEVFKLDTNKSPIGWQNVKLEDKVAFVSNWKSMVLARDELNYSEELVRGNSIYFAITFPCPKINPPTSLEFGMFCLNDSSIKYFPEETSKHGDVPCPLWFVPSLW
ncbi:F-box protein [Medicago truncatula]|uniref:F-box protein n=1 Tax=Medicago truncatula TaxID=3880 RepID=G7KT61_MEDTR|nr:F-box protein [Medicago truncatula]